MQTYTICREEVLFNYHQEYDASVVMAYVWKTTADFSAIFSCVWKTTGFSNYGTYAR
jgi:hypothetical protein